MSSIQTSSSPSRYEETPDDPLRSQHPDISVQEHDWHPSGCQELILKGGEMDPHIAWCQSNFDVFEGQAKINEEPYSADALKEISDDLLSNYAEISKKAPMAARVWKDVTRSLKEEWSACIKHCSEGEGQQGSSSNYMDTTFTVTVDFDKGAVTIMPKQPANTFPEAEEGLSCSPDARSPRSKFRAFLDDMTESISNRSRSPSVQSDSRRPSQDSNSRDHSESPLGRRKWALSRQTSREQ